MEPRRAGLAAWTSIKIRAHATLAQSSNLALYKSCNNNNNNNNNNALFTVHNCDVTATRQIICEMRNR